MGIAYNYGKRGAVLMKTDDTYEIRRALCEWKLALMSFDSAENAMEIEFTAMRIETARRRYGCLLSQYKERNSIEGYSQCGVVQV